MITPVSRSSAIELIRASSDQVRRAAELIEEITDEVVGAGPAIRMDAGATEATPAQLSEAASRNLTTIMLAQRSFAAAVRAEQSLHKMESDEPGEPSGGDADPDQASAEVVEQHH